MAEASRQVASGDADDAMVGGSPPMQKLRSRLAALQGADDTTVLINGETGTGKGVLARMIHAGSGRAYEPFVAVDCTTIAHTLVESELFGHEKGAFSGATQAKMGRVEAAGAGTLFLDEIGELELTMQTKLLRLLEEREFTRVGSTRARTLRARIITATNRDLELAVRAGWFRADLRYRLEVFVVEVPPLRDRGDDILLLAMHFLKERTRALGRAPLRIRTDVAEALRRYPFPGNVRELRNMVEQAVLLSEGDELTVDDFPVLGRHAARVTPQPTEPVREAAPPRVVRARTPERTTLERAPMRGQDEPESRDVPAPTSALGARAATLGAIRARHAEQELHTLVEALEATGGNVTQAARALGMSRYQLLRRLSKHGLR
jgi:transcriptional regulator with GAF, ATPase, and Fis domain